MSPDKLEKYNEIEKLTTKDEIFNLSFAPFEIKSFKDVFLSQKKEKSGYKADDNNEEKVGENSSTCCLIV